MADGKIVYKVVIDDNGAAESAEKSGDKAGKKFGEAIGGNLKSAGRAIGVAGAAAGAAVVAVGSKIVKETGKLAEYGDHIDKMSQKLGLSAEAYQEWDAVLQHSGASIDSLEPTMKSLFKAAQDGSDAFDALGISQKDAAKMSREDLFAATIKALQNVTDENERAALAQELLGRGAQELGPLLNTSAEETDAMRQRVHELGGVLSDEAVKSAALYQDTLQDMQTAMQGVGNQLLSQFLPDITSVMSGITTIFSGDTEGGIGMITTGLNDMLTRMIEELPKIVELGAQIALSLIQGIIDNLGGITGTGIELILTLVDAISEALPSLIESVPAIILALATGIVEHLPDILESGIKLVLALGQGLIEAIPDLVMMIPRLIMAIIDTFKNTDWGSIGRNIVAGIKDGISSMWQNLVDSVTSGVSDLWASVKDFLGIHSPSRKFRYIGEMTTEGMIEGVEDTQAELTRRVVDVYSGMTDSTQAALARSMGGFERDISFRLSATGKLPDTTIEVPVILNGREIARASAWDMGEQLAWEEM